MARLKPLSEKLQEIMETCDPLEIEGVMRALGVEQREELLDVLKRLKEDPASAGPRAVSRSARPWKMRSPGQMLGTGDFFQGMAEQLSQALEKEFDQRLDSELSRVRLAYAEAMQKEKESFQQQLWQLSKEILSKEGVGEADNEAAGDPPETLGEEQLHSFREAAELNAQVTQLLARQRSYLDQPKVTYCQATALILKDLLKRTENLLEYCHERLSALTCDFAPKNMAGLAFPVPNVRPAVETVKQVKQQLRFQHDCQSCVVKLCLTKEQVVEMQDDDFMMDYDLTQEVSLVLVDSLVAYPLVRLAFEDADNKVYESVSGLSGSVDHPEDVHFVNTMGRTGVNITNRGCLILPKTVQLGEEWTISVWTLAPIDVADHTYRDLVDAPNSQELIAVILARGRLGNYNSNSFIEGFNARDLSPGWHHICVVASGRCTTYYVDGASLGVKRGRARGTIGVVGNSRTCRVPQTPPMRSPGAICQTSPSSGSPRMPSRSRISTKRELP